jgi:Protein of unknown function (DUF4239)
MIQLWVVSTLPGWLLGIVIVGGVILLSLLGLRTVHRSVSVTVREAHNELAGFIFAVVGVLFAVTLALVVVAVWEQLESARLTAEREANAVADMYRGADGFGEADRQRLRAQLETYARAVVDDEWPSLAHGRDSDRAWEALHGLWAAYLAIEPRTSRESAVYAAAFDQLDALSDARRERLLASRSPLPLELWETLIAGAAITVGFTYFFGSKNERAHALMTAALAAMIGLGLWVTFVMDLPYSGDLAVSPAAFQKALEIFARLGR